MRIIAGTVKGRTLKSLRGLDTRPTLDRVREAVFNILGTKVLGANFLDLFAGTGAVGIEALSRGASYCCFNDQNKKACQIIKDNLQKCNFVELSRIYAMDGLRLISHLSEKKLMKFDVVYLDPPYISNNYVIYLQRLEESGLLTEKSIIIAESRKSLNLEEIYQGQGLKIQLKRSYGDTVVWFYKFLGEE